MTDFQIHLSESGFVVLQPKQQQKKIKNLGGLQPQTCSRVCGSCVALLGSAGLRFKPAARGSRSG